MSSLFGQSFVFFFFYCYVDRRYLHSFPTRRSSDLESARRAARRKSSGGGCGPGFPCGSATPRTSSRRDRKSTRLNSSHVEISYAVFCLKKKIETVFTPFLTVLFEAPPHSFSRINLS